MIMRRLGFFILTLMFPVLCHAAWASINIDTKTIAAMTAAYSAEVATEAMNNESVKKILDHYTSAEVATAGIFASKWLDRKALQNAGLFDNAEENFYYRRIYTMVSARIMPKILDVATLMIKYPEKAMYWGPYLFRVCEQTKQLCMIFETVVTNRKLSFQDIAFLAINDNLKDLFDLTKLGEVDWKAVWDKLSDFGNGITKDDLMDDLDGLMTAGGAIASAGGSVLDDAWINSSKVGNIFHMKPGEILELYDEFKDMYETFSDPGNIKDLLMEKIISTDSIGVANLFTIDGYNITSYVSDYIKEMQGQYYTQRWYIYCRDAGGGYVCRYEPPSDSWNIINGSEWYRVSTSDANYICSSTDYENSLSNSENYAGWSREKCDALEHNGDKYHYKFNNYMSANRLYGSKTGATKGFAYAHSIYVYRWWDVTEEVYDEVFDSQYDAVQAIQARFNAKLAEYNDNEEGKVYYIGKDEKHYYNAADEVKMRGCATVSFTMECHDNAKLAEGNFSWKENGDQRHALDENSKRYAMESTLSEMPETSEIDQKISDLTDQLVNISNEIQRLKNENNELLAAISETSVEEAEGLREQYNANLNQINSLKNELVLAKIEQDEWLALKQQLVDDYADERDGTYRIPAVMHDLESAYGLQWSDAGSWVGYTYIRHGNVPNLHGEVEFRADLSKERGESHNWLIGRYHRAILAVHWTLTANYDSSEIVDYIEMDPSLSDADKARQVNERLHQLQQEHPGCDIEANYAYSSPPDTSEDKDAIHLLWVCDRLKVARDVDYRLSKIYAQLVLVEKFMRSRESLLDYLKRSLGITQLNGNGRIHFGRKSFKRWRRSARAAASGEDIASVLADMDEDD